MLFFTNRVYLNDFFDFCSLRLIYRTGWFGWRELFVFGGVPRCHLSKGSSPLHRSFLKDVGVALALLAKASARGDYRGLFESCSSQPLPSLNTLMRWPCWAVAVCFCRSAFRSGGLSSVSSALHRVASVVDVKASGPSRMKRRLRVLLPRRSWVHSCCLMVHWWPTFERRRPARSRKWTYDATAASHVRAVPHFRITLT